MAYNLKQISPLDLLQSTALGVKLPFSAKSAFTSVYTTKEQYKYNVINFLLTDRGERPFNFNFGASLRTYLFEQIETQTVDSLESYIRSQIEINFSSIKVRYFLVKIRNIFHLVKYYICIHLVKFKFEKYRIIIFFFLVYIKCLLKRFILTTLKILLHSKHLLLLSNQLLPQCPAP